MKVRISTSPTELVGHGTFNYCIEWALQTNRYPSEYYNGPNYFLNYLKSFTKGQRPTVLDVNYYELKDDLAAYNATYAESCGRNGTIGAGLYFRSEDDFILFKLKWE